MSKKKSVLKIGSLNIGKNIDVILAMKIKFYMNLFNIDILCLQETAHKSEDQSRLVNIFSPYLSYWSNDPNKNGVGQGVSMITKPNIIGHLQIIEAGYLIRLELHGRKSANLYNMYYATSERNIKLNILQSKLNNYWKNTNWTSIICGDFNTNINIEHNNSIIQTLSNNNFELLSRKKNKKTYTYVNGSSKSFIDHFFISKVKEKLCYKCKIYNEFNNIICKHRLICASFKYKALFGWKTPILRSAPSRIKIDHMLFKQRQKKIRKRVNRIKKRNGIEIRKYFKYFFNKMKKIHVKSCGKLVGNRTENRQIIKILKDMTMSKNAIKIKKLEQQLAKIISKERRIKLEKLLDEFKNRGAYKTFSSRITLKRNTKFLQYGRIRTETGYEDTFDTNKIKTDTEDYYKEYLGFENEEYLPEGVISYKKQGRTYYKLREDCCEKLKEIYKPFNIDWSTLHSVIDMEEFKTGLTSVHFLSAPGMSGLPIFIFRELDDSYLEALREIFNEFISTKNIPEFLCNIQIWCLAKKKDKPCTREYSRPIGLLEHLLKVYESIIRDRVNKILKEYIDEVYINQFGFIPLRSTINPVLISDAAILEAQRLYKPIIICLLDIKKAYDSVMIFAIQLGLRRLGMKDNDIDIFMSIYRKRKAKVTSHLNFTTDFIKVCIGLTQGALLSPWIYITVIAPLAILLEINKLKMGYKFRSLSINNLGRIGNNFRNEIVGKDQNINNLFFADDEKTIAKNAKETQLILNNICWFYQFLFVALHPDKFEVLSNYWIGRVKLDGNEYDAMIFKYEELFCRINGNLIKINESNILAKHEIKLKVSIQHRHWWDRFGNVICGCTETGSKNPFEIKTYKLIGADKTVRDLGFYYNILKPKVNLDTSFKKSVKARTERLLSSKLDRRIIPRVISSCITNIYSVYFRAPSINSIKETDSFTKKAFAKKLGYNGTHPLSFLNMPKDVNGFKIQSLLPAATKRYISVIDSILRNNDKVSRWCLMQEIQSVLIDINSNFNKRKSWNEIITHRFNIKTLARTESKMVNRIQLFQFFHIQFNTACHETIFEKHILKHIDQADWGKIIAIKIFRKTSEIPSFKCKDWELKLDFEILKIKKLKKPNKFNNDQKLIWGIAHVPFYPLKEDVDDTKFRQNTIAIIEQSLATLQQTRGKLSTQSLFRSQVIQADRKIILKTSNHRTKVFVTKALSHKLCTPLSLRFNSWYPNLFEKIREWDGRTSKITNPLRKCSVPECSELFTNNHVFDGKCKLYNDHYWEYIKLIWFVFFISISQSRQVLINTLHINNVKIVNLTNKKNSESKEKINIDSNIPQIIIAMEDLKYPILAQGKINNKELFIYIIKLQITEEIVTKIWYLLASSLCYNAVFYTPQQQSFMHIGLNIQPEIQKNIFVLLPWFYKQQNTSPIKFFNIDYKPFYRKFKLELILLGQMPYRFSKHLSKSFNNSLKNITPKLVCVSNQINKQSFKIYKTQLKFFRKTRLQLGIRKVNPYKLETKSINAACPTCSNTNKGPLCRGHDRKRTYLFKRAIRFGLIEPRKISKLIAAFLTPAWVKGSSKEQNKEIKQGLKFLRNVSDTMNTPIHDIRCITVKRLNHQLDSNSWKNTNIGDLSDFYLLDEANIYDLPYYYIRRQKSEDKFLDIGIPQLFKWEIQCLLTPAKGKLTIHQLELLNHKVLKYMGLKLIRAVKGKETFNVTSDVLNRTLWFKSMNNNLTIWRILSCTNIENNDKFIFTDQQRGEFPKITLYLNQGQLRDLGFIYVGR